MEGALLFIDTSLLKAQGNFHQHLLAKKMLRDLHRNAGDQLLSKKLTFAILCSSGLNSGTEGFIFACQINNGALKVLHYHQCRSLGVGRDPALLSALRETESIFRNEKSQIYLNNNFWILVSITHLRHDIFLEKFEK